MDFLKNTISITTKKLLFDFTVNSNNFLNFVEMFR